MLSDTSSLSDFLDEPRDVSPGYHVLAGRVWRRHGEPTRHPSSLVYAAFEYRCALERHLLELWVVMRDLKPSLPEVEKLGRMSSLVKSVVAEAGDGRLLRRSLDFNRIYAREVMGYEGKLTAPDVGRSDKLWRRLSSYCHRQTAAEIWTDEDWVASGYHLLNESEEYLWQLVMLEQVGWVQPSSMPPEMQDQRRRFLAGEIDESELLRRMRLIKPVLEERLGRVRP